MAVLIAGRRSGSGERSTTRARFSTCWCNGGATPGRPRNLCANCSRSRASRLRRSSPIGCDPTEQRRRNSAYRLDMSKACGRTTGPRIRICRCDDASGRCNVSNRPDRRNGSYPFTPSSITRSTFNGILFPATRSAPSEAKRSKIGRQRRRPELEPSPTDFVRPKPSSRDSTRGGGPQGWRGRLSGRLFVSRPVCAARALARAASPSPFATVTGATSITGRFAAATAAAKAAEVGRAGVCPRGTVGGPAPPRPSTASLVAAHVRSILRRHVMIIAARAATAKFPIATAVALTLLS